MKIAFFLENIQFGGLDTFIINLLNNWNEEDELILIVNSSHPGLDLLRSRLDSRVEIKEHHVPLTWDLNKYFKLPKMLLKLLKLLYFVVDIPIQTYLLKNMFKKLNIDTMLVLNGGYPGGDSCLSATIAWGKLHPSNKAWHNFHNLAVGKNFYQGVSRLRYVRSIIIDKFVRKYTKGFISVSQSCIESLDVRDSFEKSRKKFIYNGIDLDFNLSKSKSIKDIYNIPKSDLVISVLGVYEARKGQDFIIKAFKKIHKENSNIHLFMFGRGNQKYIEYLKSEIGDNKNIYLLDYEDDIKVIYKGTDILAIPSQSHESFGYTAVEAMAYKIPVISTNIGGLPEVVKDNICGYVIESDNVNSFSCKLLELCKNKNLRDEFGENGFNRYEKYFKAKMMSDKYRKLLQNEYS